MELVGSCEQDKLIQVIGYRILSKRLYFVDFEDVKDDTNTILCSAVFNVLHLSESSISDMLDQAVSVSHKPGLKKPQIGDTWKVSGLWREVRCVRGREIPSFEVHECELLESGSVYRGVRGNKKWWWGDEQHVEEIKNKSIPLEMKNTHNVKDHKLRAQEFAKWLVDTYGIEFLNQGSGVLDVAGGRGELSWILKLQYGVNSTIVDPRNPSIKPPRSLKKLFKLKKHNISPPDHIQCLFQDYDITCQELITESSMILGMHPDQATEHIMTASTRLNKCFALIPCCVFPKENHHRQLLDGSPVISTQDLCKYIMENTTCSQSNINFQGANTVLYLVPEQLDS